MLIQLTPDQARVIGVLIEKAITTPDQYPLSLNALMLGCNQKSSRDPVVQWSENDVQGILDELAAKHLLFEQQGSGSRVIKYKHRFCNTEFSTLKFTPQQLAIICVLLLRGPQTPGELRTRTNRLAEFANVGEVESCLAELTEFNGETLLRKLPKEPGKREARYMHLFCGEEGFSHLSSEASISPHVPDAPSHASELEEALSRISALESQVHTLTTQLREVLEALDIPADSLR